MSDLNALDRLNNLKNSSNDREFTLEEQLESIVRDENLDGMSMSAMANMRAITEVTLDDDDEEEEESSFQSTKDMMDELEETDDAPEVPYKPEPRIMKEEPNMREETSKEELFNNNTNVGRKRRQGKTNSMSEVDSNPIFDQLIHDLIESLRKNKYKLGRFDDKSMNMLFDYMESKF